MQDFSLSFLENYKAVILDLDGTILDSMKVWNKVDEIFLQKRGFKVDQEYTDTVKSSSMQRSAEYTVERFGLRETPEEVIAEWQSTVDEEYRRNIRIKDGVREFLEGARAMGIRITCATALARMNATDCLGNNGVLDFFEHITTLEDLGNDVSKNDPHIFLTASGKLGLKPSECLVFEDVYVAIEGAMKGGFDTVIVYDDLSANDFEKASNVAKYVIKDWKYGVC